MVFSDELYDKAFAFKKMKKWRKLGHDFMIAIDTLEQGCWYAMPLLNTRQRAVGFLLEGGQAGLKWVLDLANQEYQENLNVYENIVQDRYHEEYVITFAELSQMTGWPDLEVLQDYCQRKGLVARGKNFYPTFRYMQPKYIPWFLQGREESLLCEKVLDALMEMDNMLGGRLKEADGAWQHFCHTDYKGTIPVLKERKDGSWQLMAREIDGHYEPKWPVAKLNDLEIARLKRVKKNADVWLVDKFLYNDVMFPEDMLLKSGCQRIKPHTLPGYYPDGVIMLNDSQGDVLVMERVNFQMEGYSPFAQMLKEAFDKCGRPRRFTVCRQESYEFFKDVCMALDIELEMVEDLPELLAIRQDCIERKDASREQEAEFDESAIEKRCSSKEQRKKQNLHLEHFADELAENEVITYEMLIVYMTLFWGKDDIALLNTRELEDVVNMCVMMSVDKEGKDYVFGELQRRVDREEIVRVELVPNSKGRKK